MYQCPNCGGELRFSIDSQDLKCTSCSSHFAVGSIKNESDSEEDNTYETAVFRCPQCGGEIEASSDSIADFCSYCGASTILSKRIERVVKPRYIIPFKKTKDDCRNAFKKYTSNKLFIDSNFKDEKGIDSFRGIYMPYWLYDVSQQGDIAAEYRYSERVGDYIYHYTYYYKANADCDYRGLSFDASSDFSDSISGAIAPFSVNYIKYFNPSYMLGFYGDSADVPAEVYFQEAEKQASDSTQKAVMARTGMPAGSMYSFNIEGNIKAADPALFPVWLMSYRKNGRVAYAAVNGQTGKVTADLPVSVGKILAGVFILAVPLFFILNIFLTASPSVILITACIAALISVIMYNSEIKNIYEKDTGINDEGKNYKSGRKKKNKRNAGAGKNKKRMKKGVMKSYINLPGILFAVVIFFYIIYNFMQEENTSGLLTGVSASLSVSQDTASVLGVISFIFAAVSLIFVIMSGSRLRKVAVRSNIPGSLMALAGQIISGVIFLINPVSDVYYYAAAIIVMAAVLLSFISVIRYFNVLTTRKLPVFEKHKGGDDRA